MVDFKFTRIFFQIHKSRLYFSNDELFSLKFKDLIVTTFHKKFPNENSHKIKNKKKIDKQEQYLLYFF